MPNRCGLMHVRPAEDEDNDDENLSENSAAKKSQQQPTQEELDSFWAGVQARLAQFTTLPAKVKIKNCLIFTRRRENLTRQSRSSSQHRSSCGLLLGWRASAASPVHHPPRQGRNCLIFLLMRARRETNAAKSQKPITQEELDSWAGVQARLAQFTTLPAKVGIVLFFTNTCEERNYRGKVAVANNTGGAGLLLGWGASAAGPVHHPSHQG
jgi:hypothetical protein